MGTKPSVAQAGAENASDIIKECFLSFFQQLCFRGASLFLCTLLCLFNSLFVFRSTCLNAYIFRRRQKRRWHTAVHQSQSSDMVIKSPSSRRAPAYQNTDTHARVVTPIAKQHKQKAILIKATSPNTGSILLFLCAPNASPPPSLALTCPVVSRLYVRPIVARTSVAARRASASKKRRRSRIETMSIGCKQQQILSVHTIGGREECVSSAE